ncbi:hypothetical protein OM076_00975 [Solirubrobacter ginsenosidimutans]|uniref:Uncharacterized protein n=1 Tax=Solirubrobacter ginsenosidimutans TaxID=490573 RepID=A0A9X3S013_9ACTN|nr:hypothetical protein [Solirubrobacter ginsenosidimutans]MDA0158821.1 hypothetical protein [Solirubrobacter ginsenosidimutans]
MRRLLLPLGATFVAWQIVQADWPSAVLVAVLVVWLVWRDIPPRLFQATSVIACAAVVADAVRSGLPWWMIVLAAASGVALVFIFVLAFALRHGIRSPAVPPSAPR